MLQAGHIATHPRHLGLLALVAGGLCCAGHGQSVQTQPATGESWLRVTADDVYLRSRADANSLPVVRVARDTLLQASGRDAYGWYRVRPPEGVFSFVAAEFVDRRGPSDGIVSVRSGTLRVRVGSLVRDVDPQQTEVQALLERGATVRILGEQGTWLRIVPPPGVFVYVAERYVQPVADEVATQLQATTPPASQPASQALAVGRAPPQPDLSGTWGQRLVAIEAAIAAEARKTLAEQSWLQAISDLGPVAAQRAEPAVARLAEAWIAKLERRTAELEAVRGADELLGRAAREQVQRERERERLERVRQAATRPVFAGLGELQRSDALPARTDQRQYKLLDPLTRRIAAYVRVGSGLDAEKLVGQYVGVRGPRRPDPALGADVIAAEEIVVVEPGAPATQPATQPARQRRS
jgi:hypothetical protein